MWLLTALLTTALAQAPLDLTVEVPSLRNADGVVRIAVFADAERFLEPAEDAAVAHVTLPANATGVKHTFSGLAPGTYAIAVIHDEDEDGKVSTNFIGIPKEGVGVSNNPKLFGPPRFKDARFELTASASQSVVVKYLL